MGPPLGRPPQGLPLAGLARRARRARPARTAAGRPATTAAPAPATASSTSWPRPSPRPAAARAPARTSHRGGEVPVTLLAAQAGGGGRVKQRVRFSQGRQGPLPVPPRRGSGLGARPAPRRRAGRLQRGVLAPAAAQLRPGPLHGLREPRRVPRHRPRRADVDPRSPARRSSTPSLPTRDGGPGRRSRSRRAPTRSSRPSPAAAGGIELDGVPTRAAGGRRRAGAWPSDELPIVVERKGTEVPSSTPGPRSSRLDRRTAPCSMPSWPPNPAASAPRSCSAPSTPRGSSAGCCEPTNGRRSTAPAASRSPSGTSAHAARRRPRTRTARAS